MCQSEFVFSDDIADALIFMLQEGVKTDDMPINIGTGVDISISDLARQIAEVVGYDGKIVWQTDKPDGTLRKLLNSDRLYPWAGSQRQRYGQDLKKPTIGTLRTLRRGCNENQRFEGTAEWVWRETRDPSQGTRNADRIIVSPIEVFVALYYGDLLKFNAKNPLDEDRDRLITSKGHGRFLYSYSCRSWFLFKGRAESRLPGWRHSWWYSGSNHPRL